MRTLIPFLLLLPLTGCFVYTTEPPRNTAPWFDFADGGCFWDNGYQDFVWYFDVDVNDDAGVADVRAVWADVYNTHNGALIDSFELQAEPGKSWYSAWIGSTTYLNPSFAGYEIFLSAEDYDGAIGSTSVFPPPCAQ